MKKVSNQKCREFVQKLESFKGSNLSGKKINNYYVVMSYEWYPLFAYDFEKNVWYQNEDRYSVSTSKQTSQSHPHKDTIKLSYEDMKKLIA